MYQTPRISGLEGAMKSRLVVGTVAGVGMMTGSALAADIAPAPAIVQLPASGLQQAAVAVPGPVYRVEIESEAAAGFGGFGLSNQVSIDVRSASGFGVAVQSSTGLGFSGPGWSDANAAGLFRLYHTVGPHGTLGGFAGAARSWQSGFPPSPTSLVAGIDADYDHDGIWIGYAAAAIFEAGTYEGFIGALDAQVERPEHFRLDASFSIGSYVASGTVVQAQTKVGYEAGGITPYLETGWSYIAGFFLQGAGEIGTDVDRQIGEGPWTITGGASAGLIWIGPIVAFGGATASLGFEYNRGDGPLTVTGEVEGRMATWGAYSANATLGFEYNRNESPLTLRGDVSIGPASGVIATAGISLAYGAGRLTGFAAFDDRSAF